MTKRRSGFVSVAGALLLAACGEGAPREGAATDAGASVAVSSPGGANAEETAARSADGGAGVVGIGLDALGSSPATSLASSPVGGACAKDTDCAGESPSCISQNGEFPGGYCVIFSCGANSPCPIASACFRVNGDETACLPTCEVGRNSDCRSGYVCLDPGVCMPACTATSCAQGEVCGSSGSCEPQRCTPTSCGPNQVCDGTTGRCVTDPAKSSLGRVPSCTSLPDWRCNGTESYCGELLPFEPDHGPGYWDYPINGETATNQYRSYVRRDVMMLVKYAAAAVDCLGANWASGNHQPLGLGDMSEQNGAIPGTSLGSAGHPAGTHEFGHDMDIGYYQLTTPDNKLREICPHMQNGRDALHCVAPPTELDAMRTALFIGLLHESPQLRVVGCDGQVGPLLESAISELCAGGWLTGRACRSLQLTYEVTDEGRGWFLFHLHHFHISLRGRTTSADWPGASGKNACLSPDCSARAHDIVAPMNE